MISIILSYQFALYINDKDILEVLFISKDFNENNRLSLRTCLGYILDLLKYEYNYEYINYGYSLTRKYTLKISSPFFDEKFGKDYIIMTEPEAAEVKGGTIIAKSIGIGVVFPVDKKGNVEPGWSLVILEPGSYGIFTDDDQWVYDSGDKKIKAVKSSDESIATVSFEENKVYAHGQQKKGTCKFKIVFEDGTSHVLGISVIGDYSEVYDELMGEANKRIKK